MVQQNVCAEHVFVSLLHHFALTDLGSGLIDQSQKMTVAAMAMADMKVWAHRS